MVKMNIYSEKYNYWCELKNNENKSTLCDLIGREIISFSNNDFSIETIEKFLDVYLLGFHRGFSYGNKKTKI